MGGFFFSRECAPGEGRAVLDAVSPPIVHSLVASAIKQARRHTTNPVVSLPQQQLPVAVTVNLKYTARALTWRSRVNIIRTFNVPFPKDPSMHSILCHFCTLPLVPYSLVLFIHPPPWAFTLAAINLPPS